MSNPVAVYDFTIGEHLANKDEVIAFLETLAKKWCFQLEQGEETGYRHWQGRMSLKVKTRLTTLAKKFVRGAHLSPTCDQNKGNMFYVMKDETRLEGPWKDDDEEEKKMPFQLAKITTFHLWQGKIKMMMEQKDERTVHLIYDKEGCKGKSTFVLLMMWHKLGRKIPFCNDYRDIMRMVMDMPDSPAYFIDMPRAASKDKLYQMFSAIEEIKNGYAYDDRYKFQEKIFDAPQVFVFTNKFPDLELLSNDRWKFWQIKDLDLVPYYPSGAELQSL